uniref:Uncharacterized protein n=1 Tax=Prymnesium polylepis TaxID=72548 RepID=A0A7S4MVH9_9EUKA
MIEALVQIAQKGGASMLALTLSGESQLGHATLYVVVGWWAGASLMTVWWLRKALHALEASRVLPIEYGTFTATSVLLGLIVYDEAKWVSTTNRWLMAIGISIIVGGCALVGGRRPIRISSLTPQQQALSETLL